MTVTDDPPPIGSSYQQAGAFASWKNLIDRAKTPEADAYGNRYDNAILCIDDPSCNIDEFVDETKEFEKGLIIDTNEVLIETAPLVVDPSPVPTDKVGVAGKILKSGLDALELLWGFVFGDDPEAENVSIEGEVGSFDINPSFDRFVGTISADIASGLIDESILGINFFVDGLSLLDNPISYGVGTFSQLTQGSDRDRIVIAFSQIEGDGPLENIPTPATLLLVLIGIAGLHTIGNLSGIRELSRAGFSSQV